MQFRVTLVGSWPGRPCRRDAVLDVDAASAVGEVARALLRAGAGAPGWRRAAVRREAPVTLRIELPGREPLVLDAGDPVGSSGLRSGAVVTPVPERAPGPGRRTRAPRGRLTVGTGAQAGVAFLLVAGEQTIGRDRSNRVQLHDASVSRRHARLSCGPRGIELEDLGSANGIRRLRPDGRAEHVRLALITGDETFEVGAVRVRIAASAPEAADAAGRPELVRACAHVRPPRAEPVFAPDPLELPAPPAPIEPSRAPFLALLAPVLMGGSLAAATGSAASLLFAALSPLLALGSWLDGRSARRTATRSRRREFEARLAEARAALERNREVERAVRHAQAPPGARLLDLPETRAPELWARRPGHPSFLELRVGVGTLPSRAEIRLPSRGQAAAEHWAALRAAREEFRAVAGVPTLASLGRSGSLAVVGPAPRAAAVARALLVQLAALHSPAEVVIAAFAGAEHDAWGWLAWLPHVGAPHSPMRGPHLAAGEAAAAALLERLEALVRLRTAAGDPAGARSAASPGGGAPRVVVLVLPGAAADRARLVGLAEDGPAAGVHLVWLAAALGEVPAACRAAVEVGAAGAGSLLRDGERVTLDGLDALGVPEAHRFARGLAPVVDADARVADETDLPGAVALARLLRGDPLGSPASIAAAWRAGAGPADANPAGRGAGLADPPIGALGALGAVVGQGARGPVVLDLRAHGPHALVAGTTGSGKSEFLQSWILSLAASHGPDRIAFLLVDYKGGAAFAECGALPHVVGLVTDLGPRLVRRALVSLRAELRRREELLAERGAKDLATLERRGDPGAPPALVIVIDEFAALVADVPEFVDGVIDVAQRGRSLGLHLVLATQRPAGVVREHVRANTNLRIALRVADPADSVDVLGTADAAGFPPDAPGRAALRVGAGRPVAFQSAYAGGRSDTEHREAVEVRGLGFGDSAPWPLLPELRRGSPRGPSLPSDAERLTRTIRAAAAEQGIPPPRRPWVEPLPEALDLDDAELAAASGEPEGSACPCSRPVPDLVAVGLVDQPRAQRRVPLLLPLARPAGLAIFGGPRSGKTTCLISLACAAVRAAPDALVYGIDAADGRLAVLERLPGTGAIVRLSDRGRVARVLRLVRRLIAERRGEDGPAARARRPPPAPPPVLLLVDGLAALRDALEQPIGGRDPFADLVEVARAGRAAGVQVALACERAGALPAALSASIGERLVLPLPSAGDARLLGVPAGVLEDAPPGRAVRAGGDEEIQWALPGGSPDPSDVDAAVVALAAGLDARGAPRAPAVPALPLAIARAAIPPAPGGAVAFGVDTADLAPVAAPDGGLVLVTGPAGSGRSTAVRCLLEAFAARPRDSRGERSPGPAGAGGAGLRAVLLAPRPSAIRDAFPWAEVGDDPTRRASLLARLAAAVGLVAPSAAGSAGRRPGGPAPARDAPPDPPLPDAVVVEDVGGFDGSGDERALAALLKRLRGGALPVIVEGENATIGNVWELLQPLRGARWALALRPDTHDTPAVFTAPFPHARRAEYPPGRGLLVRNGATIEVQVGLPAARGPDP